MKLKRQLTVAAFMICSVFGVTSNASASYPKIHYNKACGNNDLGNPTVGDDCWIYTFVNEPGFQATISGDIPPGLHFVELQHPDHDHFYALRGILSSPGVYNFSVQFIDEYGVSNTKTYSLQVNDPIILSDPEEIAAEINIPFSYTFSPSGGEEPYRYNTFGDIPDGLSFINNTLSGTPNKEGDYKFTVVVGDKNGIVPFNYTIKVFKKTEIFVDDASLAATVNQPFSYTFTATGGKAPYTFQKLTGVLPSGLSLTGDTISGTPTSVNTHQFDLRVTDAECVQATKTFDIEVKKDMRPPIATDFSLSVPSRDTGVWVPFDVRDHITNYGDPADQIVIKGASVAGVDFNISGLGGQIFVPISAVGSVQVQYTVSNSWNGGVESNIATITINLADPFVSIVDVQTSNTILGQPFQARFNAIGAASPYSYSISGDVPPGLLWSEITNAGGLATYELSSTPHTAGLYNFALDVTDANGFTASKQFTMDLAAPLTITDPSASVQYGQSVSVDLKDYISGSYSDIQIPTGQTHGTVTVSGTIITYTTPASDGELVAMERIGFSVLNPQGNRDYGTINITVDAPSKMTVISPTLSVVRDSSIEFDLNDYITLGYFDLVSVYVTQPPTSGTLSDLGGGKYSYTPNIYELNAETITIPFSAYERNLGPVFGSVTIEVGAKKTVSLQGALITGKVGVPISHKIGVNGGVAPFVITSMMGLPAGLVINDDTLEGTPEKDGVFMIMMGVRDAEGTTGNGMFRLKIAPADAVVKLPAQTFNGKVGVEFPVTTISATGDQAPYSFAVKSGALPAGMAFANGELSGLPTAEGLFTFEIEATDANGVSGVGTVVIEIAPVDAVVEVTLPALKLSGKVGDEFTQQFLADGGSAPYAFIVVDILPAGLTLTGDTVSGTPTAEGTFSFELQATDANGVIGSQTYSISIAPADVVIPAPKADNGTIELEYGQTGQISLASLVTGDVDAISIVTQPSKGTVAFDGVTATYVPTKGAVGGDQFTFMAANAGGSVTATVSITIKAPVGEVPVAKDHVVRLDPLQSGTVLMTEGAVSVDPINKAHVLTSVAKSEGSTKVFDKEIKFTPNKAFAGSAVVSYQLENKWGRSNVATITFVVAPRPDPSKDAEVAALIKAQMDAAIKLTDDQVDNITKRIEEIRSEAPGQRLNSVNWDLGVNSTDVKDDEDTSKDSTSLRGDFKSDNPLALWSTGYVRLGEHDDGKIDFSTTAYGGTAGLDYRFHENFVGGVAVGYGREVAEIGENGTENEARAISGVLYGTWHNQGGAFIDGIFGFSHLTMDSSRYVTSNGDMAYGSRSGSTVFGSVIGGYRVETESGLKIEPYAGFRGVTGKLNGFTEYGANWNSLAYGDTNIRSLKAVAGVRLEKDFETEDILITPSFKAEYRHELAGGTTTALGYADLGTMPYSVTTEASESQNVVASLSVRVKPKGSNIAVEGNVQANFNGSSKPSTTYSVKLSGQFCGFGSKEGDCMSREDKVVYFKVELVKANKAKNKARIVEVSKLLAKAEADLKDWRKLSKNAKPLPELLYVDTISGKK